MKPREFWMDEIDIYDDGACIVYEAHLKKPKHWSASAKRIHVIEHSTYLEILEKYKSIELANKEMSRNDHVHFGDLLLERDALRTLCAEMAVALEDTISEGYIDWYTPSDIAKEALKKLKKYNKFKKEKP